MLMASTHIGLVSKADIIIFAGLIMLTDKTTKALLSSFAISLWNTIISDEYFSTESTSRLLDSLITYLTLRQETLHKIKVYSYFAIFCLVFPYLT